MQIVDELEPVRRGPYSGAVGFVSNCGLVTLNVGIRTMLLTPRTPAHPSNPADDAEFTIDYSAGCGIVADSEPEDEFRVSGDKTAVLGLE